MAMCCYMVYLITFRSDCKRSRMWQQVLSPDTQTGSHLWTPVLFKLHWLPIKGRILYYKILLLYKALNGLAPPYITDLIYLRVILDPRRIRNWKYHIIIYVRMVIDRFRYPRNLFGTLYQRTYDYMRLKTVFKNSWRRIFPTGVCQSLIVINSISIFRVRTFNFYASDELVNFVSGFIILSYYAHFKALLYILEKALYKWLLSLIFCYFIHFFFLIVLEKSGGLG